MSASSEAIQDLLDAHGQTFADEAGITLRDQPAPLSQLLVLTALLSANLDARLGVRAARALFEAGLTTGVHLADAADDDRHRVLTEAKYLRKKQTAHQLGQLAERLVEEYDGDLRRLRDAADGDVDAMHEELTGFAGIGPLGATIFLREVQAVWPSIRPYADDTVLDLARGRDLPHTPSGLARAAGTDDLSTLGAALIRAS